MDVKRFLFNIGDKSVGIPRNLTKGVSTRVFFSDNVMLSVVELEPNAGGRPHSHPEEQWGLCIEGEAIRTQGDIEFAVKAGDFWYTPPNVMHSMRTGDSKVVVLDIFGPPREAYKTAGDGYGPGTAT
jgi:quercetin dioxygenase-like cupin family protein